MPDHDNPIRNFVNSTRRCLSLLTGLFSSVVWSSNKVEVSSVCYVMVGLVVMCV